MKFIKALSPVPQYPYFNNKWWMVLLHMFYQAYIKCEYVIKTNFWKKFLHL